jgi:hypothetical protein
VDDDVQDDLSTFVAWASGSERLAVAELGKLARDLKSMTDVNTSIHGLSDEVATLVVDYMNELAAFVEHLVVNVDDSWYVRNAEVLIHNFAGANNDATSGIKVFCDDPANKDTLFVVEDHGQQTLAMMRHAYGLVRELTPDAVNAKWKMSVTSNVGNILRTNSSSL